jgi:aryl-alcohol dehydrogenase-like predicted oxidoreductase
MDAAQLEAATPKWQRIQALHAFSKSTGRSLLDMAFQFCRGTPAVGLTLLGMRTESHLSANLRYFQAAPLSAAEYTALRNVQ